MASFDKQLRQLPRAPVACLLAALVLAASAMTAHAGETIERRDLEARFRNAGVTGAFALYDVAADRLTLVNAERAEKRVLPASTFKIANSLIALETGAVADENEIVPYGGAPQPIKAWERDMSMREAIAVSNVPVYKAIARRVGLDVYRAWLARLGYGNEDPGGDIDTAFWLVGPLTISAVEQVHFLAALAEGRLPASARAQSIVRDILLQEQRGDWRLYAKTGWATAPAPDIGWWVGWLETEAGLYTFALVIDVRSRADVDKRIPLAKALLREAGVLLD